MIDMTVAVMVKVFDGVVLATDSASTATLTFADGREVDQVYNNANKLFHLHRGLPIGAMTWGLGNVADANIATIAKDLRRRLMGENPALDQWKIDPESYSIQEVAERAIDMMFEERYQRAFPVGEEAPDTPLGFLIAGYSGANDQAEAWIFHIESNETRPVPTCVAGPDNHGWAAYAQPQATVRLLKGFDPSILSVLGSVLDDDAMHKVAAALGADGNSNNPLEANVALPSMPIADAIALARYLGDVTVGYSRFNFGTDSVGGPVEVAAITRHEGFKWVSRKHYYSPELNPKELDHGY